VVVTWRGAGIGGRIVLVILWYYCGTSTCSYLKKISTVRKRRKKEHTDGSRRICVSSPKDRVDVFDVMGFVDDNVFEKNLLQGRCFDQAHFVRGDTHFFGACQRNDIEIRSPPLDCHDLWWLGSRRVVGWW
jgi:hypothetical protein